MTHHYYFMPGNKHVHAMDETALKTCIWYQNITEKSSRHALAQELLFHAAKRMVWTELSGAGMEKPCELAQALMSPRLPSVLQVMASFIHEKAAFSPVQ